MKKIAIALLVTFGLTTMVSAEIGLKVGVSAQVGDMSTSGKEVSSDGTTVTSETEKALFATAGFFIEKDLAFLPGPFGRLSVGYDNIAHDLDLGEQSNYREASLRDAGSARSKRNHTVEAEVTGFDTLYATLNITDWLYLKAGSVTVDVTTKFINEDNELIEDTITRLQSASDNFTIEINSRNKSYKKTRNCFTAIKICEVAKALLVNKSKVSFLAHSKTLFNDGLVLLQ